MEFRWVIDHDVDEDEVDRLQKELGIPRVLAHILLKRGIDSFEKARPYFRPDLGQLHDPYRMRDMDKAVDRLHRALENGENILVYGDYDVDGVCGSALLYLVLSHLVGSRVSYYIPDRISEGYGLSQKGVQECADRGISLIVTVDCGITAVEEVAFARQLGLDVIVCDHHEPGATLPPAVAVLDPKRPDCDYPFKELAGVGVAFKFMQGLYQRLGLNSSELDEYLDIVALGSSADIVPLIDENRILVRHGLDRINFNPRCGVRALLESSGIDKKEVTVGLIVFVLAPRINAVGRMGDARRAVQLLTATSLQQARELARELEQENRVRRNVDETTFKEALEFVETHLDPENDYALVLHKEGWHPGVIGIVASRIAERFYRPTVIISVSDGIGKGSGRSIARFNIYEAIRDCAEFLEGFGGHKYAAGLTISASRIPEFAEQFRQIARERLTEEDLIPTMNVDCEVELKEFDEHLMRLLKLMGPFGPMNMRPVFVSRNLNVVGEPSVVGTNHLRFSVEQDGVVMNAIGFNLGERLEVITRKAKPVVDCVYVVEENHWNGRKEIQLRIKDLK
ncbi:MAG: single-stranded-DNA-specific exonuclease RecJ [Calditrichaeota bacterium]|nr:MAG: single-stranded-DNA-specific exonuclease RecJ [Calditrichota bacterium]